jgi:hypothetical protein
MEVVIRDWPPRRQFSDHRQEEDSLALKQKAGGAIVTTDNRRKFLTETVQSRPMAADLLRRLTRPGGLSLLLRRWLRRRVGLELLLLHLKRRMRLAIGLSQSVAAPLSKNALGNRTIPVSSCDIGATKKLESSSGFSGTHSHARTKKA